MPLPAASAYQSPSAYICDRGGSFVERCSKSLHNTLINECIIIDVIHHVSPNVVTDSINTLILDCMNDGDNGRV